MRSVQDLIAEFGNFIFKEISASIIRREGLDTETGRLFRIAFIFFLSVQSEGLPAQRASSLGRLLGKSPISAQALIAISNLAGGDRLVLKLRTSKNVRRGPILTRPCLCSGNIIDGECLCPVRDFRPAVRRATDIGAFLVAGIGRKNLNRILKASLASLAVIDTNLYSMRGFRRSRIVETKRSGSKLGVILGSGGWGAAGFEEYLLSQEDEELVSNALLTETDMGIGYEGEYSSSDDEYFVLRADIAIRDSER